MKGKLVSICIPTYNSAKYIDLTLESLINQTYQNIEIIVGDNASTDNTKEKVEKYQQKDNRIIYYKNEKNLGYSGNCNKLISLSKGEYVAIYHSDDIYDKTIIEKEIKYLEKNSKLAGVFTLAKLIDKDNKKLSVKGKFIKSQSKNLNIIGLDEFIKNILKKGGNLFVCPTSMIRKNIYEEIGGYNTSLKYIEDQDMWLRILIKYSMGILNEKLINYRIHKEQVSFYYSDINRKEITVIISHLEKFLKKNKLEGKYVDLVDYYKAKDYIILAIYAVKLKKFKLFEQRIEKSKKYCKLSLKTKLGLIQRVPVNIFKWNFLKFYLKIKFMMNKY